MAKLDLRKSATRSKNIIFPFDQNVKSKIWYFCIIILYFRHEFYSTSLVSSFVWNTLKRTICSTRHTIARIRKNRNACVEPAAVFASYIRELFCICAVATKAAQTLVPTAPANCIRVLKQVFPYAFCGTGSLRFPMVIVFPNDIPHPIPKII